ncbi:hypothetical protein NQ176_g8381 [Zarea fungicola]|uniref:Uncharacterized protein n=1 Tax=Zarea fungicola TaxID=93591 RepID=A0ACC1MUT2_9HYPO|nr:hypothetical protein NQ176_g8381 [Lecanicillium fungicola]
MVSGLIIARGARRNRTDGVKNSANIGGDVDVPGAAQVGANIRTSETKVGISGQFSNDFVWAVRLTEVSMPLFSSDIVQKTFTKGATLQSDSDKVDVSVVLKKEGLKEDSVRVLRVLNGNTEEAFITLL